MPKSLATHTKNEKRQKAILIISHDKIKTDRHKNPKKCLSHSEELVWMFSVVVCLLAAPRV